MTQKFFHRNIFQLLALLKSNKYFLLMQVVCFLSLLLGTVYFPPFPHSQELVTAKTNTHEKTIVGYFQSWSEKGVSSPEQLQLANIAPYVNLVIVSFMQPDSTYNSGNYDLTKTGLQFTANGKIVKDGIALLKKRNPKTKLLLAVGGLSYTNFVQLNAKAIAPKFESLKMPLLASFKTKVADFT